MKSKIFSGDPPEYRSSIKCVPVKASEAASILSYKGCHFKEDPPPNNPNNNKLNKPKLHQKHSSAGNVSVSSARVKASLNNY